MKKQIIVLCIFMIFAILFAALPRNLRSAEGTELARFVPGEVIVGLQDISISSIQATETMGGTVVKQITSLNAMVVQVAVGEEEAFIQSAKSISGFKYAELNGMGEAAYVPNDQHWDLQWNMRTIKADQAWNIYKGFTDIVIAIIDSGIDYNHVDLSTHYVAGGYDWVNNDNDPMDDNSHGTHCAGIASAEMDNNVGVVGVAQCSIWSEKVLDSAGFGANDDLASGITHSADNDVDIISMSLQRYPYSNLVESACTYAWNHGVLLVACAGNDQKNIDTDPCYPASYNTVIAVSATTSNDIFDSSYSNYGNKIELSAPGTNVYSTIPDNSYGYMTGTSMACPHVAGLAALLWSYKPTLANNELRNNLHNAIDDLGTTGKDIYYGYGRINAEKAITFPRLENPATFATTGAIPTKLAVYLSPPSIPAQVGNYYCIFIQLQDAGGNPAYAPANGVGISLKSSNATLGAVSTTSTIPAGKTFVRTYFAATTIRGTTSITASASDYTAATATLTTVVPTDSLGLNPKLVVYTNPPKLPADSSVCSYVVTVQLQNSSGTLLKAPSPGVQVALSSSNVSVGTVTPPTIPTIPTGQTFVQATFTTTYISGSTVITAVAPGYQSDSATILTVAAIPTRLTAYAVPPTVPADHGTYSNVFVQLQDAIGRPARAPANIQAALVSSNPLVGTVSSTTTIYAGSTFSKAYFYPTYTPGTTIITVVAIGYSNGSVAIKTVGPQPRKLAVYPGPLLPADNQWYYTTAVQLQDATGEPAKAPDGGEPVVLTSSNPLVATVSSPTSIPAGSSYVHIAIRTTGVTGSTTITAIAAKYGTASATITTVVPSGYLQASKLAVYSVPPRMLSEGATYQYPVVVQLQDAVGNPARAPVGGIGVCLSSTSPTVGTVNSIVTISQDATSVRTSFSATYTPGTTSIKAVVSGYASGSGAMTTTGIVPTQLCVYAGLQQVPADGGGYSIVVVQLQDAGGNPARSPLGGVGISLWSSNPQIGTVSNTVSVSAGSTYATAAFSSTYNPGSTNIAASVAMLSSTLSLSVKPSTVIVGGQLTISGQLWPKISATIYLYYRSGVSPWTLAATITTNSAGSYSITATIPSMPKSTYDMVAVWLGSKTYKGAVSEIRSFTVV